MRTTSLLSIACLVTACSGATPTDLVKDPAGDAGTTTSPNDPAPGRGAGASGSSTSPKPEGATTTTCKAADDCGYWFCDCKDASGRVSPVNARNCKDGFCLDAARSCPSACGAFGKEWAGTAGGGPAKDPPKGEACGGRWFNGTCGDCFSRACCAKGDACAASASCRALHDCIAACQGSEPCLASCERAHPGGVSTWNAMAGCLEGACRVECGF